MRVDAPPNSDLQRAPISRDARRPEIRYLRRLACAVIKAVVGLLLVAPCLAQPPEPAPPTTPAAGVAPTQAAELYVFNDSGRTLVASNQVVTDNGRKIASLPRQTYVKLYVAPGAHLLKPDPPLWKQQVSLTVAAGGRYFVVVAYKPERSWAAPLAGTPLILHELTEEQAAPLLREMKAQ